MKVLETISEIIGWLRIVISPTGIGLLLGGICYFNLDKPWGLVTGIALSVSGLVIGIVIATRALKRKGTVHLLSRTMASPELDDREP